MTRYSRVCYSADDMTQHDAAAACALQPGSHVHHTQQQLAVHASAAFTLYARNDMQQNTQRSPCNAFWATRNDDTAQYTANTAAISQLVTTEEGLLHYTAY